MNYSTFTSREGVFATYAAIFIFVVSIAAYGGLYFINKSQEGAQAVLIQQIQQKQEDLQPKVLDQIYALQKKLESINLVISSHPFSANTFSLIENDTHPRVQFTSYSFDGKSHKVVFRGEAQDYLVLARQISLFESNAGINKVEFGGFSIRESGRVGFNLTLYLLPGAIASVQ
ncbi:MAG: hypothetical protein U1A25_01340 [Candidatus Sungbacteria bacterium]|nr:hypothetical protein [bacterium]MDZ4260284.1 hypothetical protein [Candidatus Sungbacteria bacterium]